MLKTGETTFSKAAFSQQAEQLYKNQKHFFDQGRTLSIDFRLKMLQKLKELILRYEKDICLAVEQDFRKSPTETYITEIALVIDEIDLIRKKLKKWARPRRVKSSLLNYPSADFIHPSPYGVALVIGAWNYPFQLTILPVVGAIAAGNCVVIKPSELAANTSALIHKMIREEFDPEFAAVLQGGVEANQALLDQPFHKIFFTGSTRVGKIVMQAAAKHLASVTLELGGKSPAIVHKDANIELAARRLSWGKFINAGQTCVAPDYVLVHEEAKEPLLKALKKSIEQHYGLKPQNSPDMPRIINDQHFERLTNYLQEGSIYTGGETNPEENYIAPTILEDVNWDSAIMQEEIFGPILPILTFKELEEVPALVRRNERPLALYLFTSAKKNERLIINSIPFGGGCINDTVVHLANPNLPFGGVGNSGQGGYHGKHSFDTFSHPKSVLKRGTWMDVPLRYPPYKGKIGLFKKLFKWA